ncbi:MAG: TRAP transporter permease, partial [bacterium]
ASIAKASPMKIGVKATQIAIAGFVIPYMAVYTPALMLQGEWTVVAVIYIVGKALLAIALWGATAVGYLLAPLKVYERVFTAVAAMMLVAAVPLTDQIGFAMTLLFMLWHVWQKRQLAAV